MSDAFTTTAQSGLQRPSWDVDNIIEMDAARRAQAALVFSLTPVTMPDKLTACAGDDALTYGGLNWQDADGNLYAAASLIVSDTFVSKAQSTLSRPSWDTDSHVNMAGAGRAQAALVVSLTPVAAMHDKLTACVGDDALATLAAMGLTQVEVDV